MKMTKKILSLALVATMTLGLSACGSSSEDGVSNITLSLSHAQSTDHPFHAGATKFAELVEEKTDGNIKVEVYPAAQLGSGSKMVENVQLDTVDLCIEATMATDGFIPETGVLNLPFLFEDEEQAFEVIDGEVGKAIEKAAEEKGFKIIGWIDNGFRDISNTTREISSPADLKGLKIRVPESQVFLDTFEALGAIPTPMAMSEVFSAMQLHTVEGQENPSSIFITQKFNEVNPYYSTTHHIFTFDPLLMSLEKFEALSEKDQQAVLEAGKEACEYQRQVAMEAAAADLQNIKDSGVTITEVDNLDEWKEAVQSVYDKNMAVYGDLLEMLLEATSK